MSAKGPASDDYALRRDYAASSRLNLQSYLWRDSLGYMIHPSVPPLPTDARIADIATGTGIWLTQLAREWKSSSIWLDGFDIDISQCPPAEWMPLNVRFRVWNAFEDVPTELHEKYDLVHIRLFMINIKDNDSSAIVRNVLKMLKPGGWLQWEEVDNTKNYIAATDGSVESPAMESLLEYIHEGSKRHRGSDDWFFDLPSTLKSNGFVNAVIESHMDPPTLRRWVYEAWLLTLEEFSTTKLKGTEQETINLKLIKDSHVECKQGAAIQLGKLICIAQKMD